MNGVLPRREFQELRGMKVAPTAKLPIFPKSFDRHALRASLALRPERPPCWSQASWLLAIWTGTNSRRTSAQAPVGLAKLRRPDVFGTPVLAGGVGYAVPLGVELGSTRQKRSHAILSVLAPALSACVRIREGLIVEAGRANASGSSIAA